MRMKNKNILIILVIGIVLIVSIFFSFSKLHNYKELPKREIKENTKKFALMLEQNNGEYKESTGDLPKEGYVFNINKSRCVDEKGNLVENAIDYSYENYSITINSSKTIYCSLYYDQEPNIGYLRIQDTDKNLSNELVDELYRYQGTDNVSNWICFGTSNQEVCKSNIDKYMYRIIGINAKGELYLLKETFLKEGEVTGFAWNDEYLTEGSGIDVCKDGICPEWNESDLFQRINGIANGKTPGGGNANDGKDDDTDIFVDNSYYDYLKSGDEVNGGEASDWYNLIEYHDWYYGDIAEFQSILSNELYYNVETGKSETIHYVKNTDGTIVSENYKWTNKVKAKVSLMYLHDVVDANFGDVKGSVTSVKNSWIHFQKDGYNSSPSYEWLSTRWGIYSADDSSISSRAVNYSGYLGAYKPHNGFGVRPVFYITNNINLTGSGTKENPFVIGM